jgi:hypothetical protein
MTPSRRIDRPEPGFFRMRLVRGGVFVGARIYRPCPMHPETCEALDRWFDLEAEIDGEPADVLRVWESGDPITPAEFAYLDARGAWARRVVPDHPFANPRRPVTWAEIPVLFHER